jgi:hypothetical protein
LSISPVSFSSLSPYFLSKEGENGESLKKCPVAIATLATLQHFQRWRQQQQQGFTDNERS